MVCMMLLLEYSVDSVPAGGYKVYSQTCTLLKSYRKEAAGHIFHSKALLQLGLVSGRIRWGLYGKEFGMHM